MRGECVKAEKNGQTQRHLVCPAREMTKALPPVISLYLWKPTSFHPFIISCFFRVPVPFLYHLPVHICRFLTILQPANLFQLPLPNISLSSPALISAAFFLSSFCPFLASFLPSSSASLPPFLILQPPPPFASSSSYPPPFLPTLYTHNLSTSVTLFFFTLSTLPWISASVSSPRCVVIAARLATAATTDIQGVGEEGGVDDDWGKEGKMKSRF